MKNRIEYLALLLFEAIFRALPYWACVGFAVALSRLAFHVVRWRRAEAERRIMSVTGASAKDARRIAYESLRGSMLTIAEIMHGRAVRDTWIRRHVSGAEEAAAGLKALVSGGRGVVLALPHMGNWYLAGSIMAERGVPMCAVAGRQRNPLSNAWMNRRLYGKMTVLERGSSAIRECVKRLRSGNVMAILPDVRVRTPDLQVPFLGGVANIGRGMAAFARKTNSPIVVAKVRRDGLTHHTIAISDPIEPDPSLDAEADIRRMTTLVLSAIDQRIHDEPGQWFWYNKRWVLDPVSGAAAPDTGDNR